MKFAFTPQSLPAVLTMLLISFLGLAALIGCFDLSFLNAEIVITPVFQTAYRLQFYAVVAPYLLKEYQRRDRVNTPAIRYLDENDKDLEADLTGRTAIITGGSRGLGVEVVKSFLRKGAHVITTSSSRKAEEIAKRYAKITDGLPDTKWKLEIWYLDLMSMKTVQAFADRFKRRNNTRLSYFIANAGLMFPPYRVSENGFESQFSINYLGHALLAYNLLPSLYETAKQTGQQSRMVLVSSCLHHIPTRIRWDDLQAHQVYSPEYSYGLSKVAIIMFTKQLTRVLRAKGDWGKQVKVFAVHPGLVDTDLLRTIEFMKRHPVLANQIALRTPRAGAETILYAALSNELLFRTGEYFEDSRPAEPSSLALSQTDQDKMWQVTRDYLKAWNKGLWFEDL